MSKKRKPVPGPPWQLQQIPLFSAIAAEITRQVGDITAYPRYMNAIISAANAIVDEFATDERKAEEKCGLAKWLASDDTGTSSMFMAFVMHGGPLPGYGTQKYSHPYDPSDFGRCLGLLRSVPEFREKLSLLADKSDTWKGLVENWAELESLYDEEFPNGTAPKLYARMKELVQ